MKHTLAAHNYYKVGYSHLFSLVLQVFHNCTCVGEMMSPGMNKSAVLGQCARKSDCDRIFKIYMSLSVLGSFISACGGTPGYIVLLRSERVKLKGLIPQLGYDTLQHLIGFYKVILCHYDLLKGVSKHRNRYFVL